MAQNVLRCKSKIRFNQLQLQNGLGLKLFRLIRTQIRKGVSSVRGMGMGVKFPILDEKSQSMFTCGAYESEPQKSAEIFFHITKISIKEKFMCCLELQHFCLNE